MEYYYTNKYNISSTDLLISESEAHHLKNVLRKKIGDELYVTDGERNLFKTKIISIEKETIRTGIIEKFFNLNEPNKYVHLFISLLKNPSRFEFAIEKCVEIGVSEITPMITEHVINKKLNKRERWQSIALSAMKQSQRCYLPKINSPIQILNSRLTIGQVFQHPNSLSDKINLLADEKAETKLSLSLINLEQDSHFRGNELRLFIGPEGGFSNEEIEFAEKNGFKIFSLGKRKLRSETAAIVAVNNLLF